MKIESSSNSIFDLYKDESDPEDDSISKIHNIIKTEVIVVKYKCGCSKHFSQRLNVKGGRVTSNSLCPDGIKREDHEKARIKNV